MILVLLFAMGCSERPQRGTLKGGPVVPPSPEYGANNTLTAADLPPGTEHLRLGVTPYLGPALIDASWKPIASYLGDQLGIPVLLVSAKSYEDLIQLVAKGEVDIASLSPLSYVLARQRTEKLTMVAHELANGATSFSSYIMVKTDDPTTSIYDLVGRRIAFVDPRSTSGFLFAYAAFLDHGIDPETQFKEVVFSGSHVESIKLLASGRVDAAAIGSGMLSTVNRDPNKVPGMDTAGIRILLKAGRIPFDPLCVKTSIPATGVDKIKNAILTLNTRTSEGRQVLSASPKISGWVAAEDSQYDNVRHVLKRVTAHRNAAKAKQGVPTP
jgi:phosphonate transport system substrate-binding protein